MKLSDTVSQFRWSTFVELLLIKAVLITISEALSKMVLSVEFTQLGELM